MVEILRDYWEILLAVAAGVLWTGRLQQRVKNLEESDCVQGPACSSHRSACQKMQATEFAHGQSEFEDIKRMIARVKRCSEEQHNMIMKHLLDNKK